MNTTQNATKSRNQLVELRKIKTDISYQRLTKHDLLQEITQDWSDEAADRIILSERKDGSLWYIDGQHRGAAAQMLKKKKLPAKILTGLTLEQEAKLRHDLNHRKGETPGERFKAKLIYKDPRSLAIMEIARKVGMKIGLDRQKGDSVNAISALENLWNVDKGVTLTTVLKWIKEARGELNSTTASRTNLLMLKWFHEHHINEVDRKRLLTVLRLSAAVIEARADQNRVNLGSSMWVNQYRVLVDLYNEGQPKPMQLTAKLKGHAKATEPR